MTTTFLDAGFLSDEHQSKIPTMRKANSGWFSLLEDTSAIMQQTAAKASETVKGSPFDPHPLGLLVLHRANGFFQGAILMLERGMIVEAKTLTRSALECAFVLAAVKDKPKEVRAMMIADMDAAKKGQAKAILKTGAGSDTKALEDRIKDFGKARNISIDELAELGVLSGMYLNYRVLSNDAAHPSGKSLSRHMNKAADGKSWGGYLVGGGSDPEIAQAADDLVLIGMAIGIAFQEMVGDTDNNARMGEVTQRLDELRRPKTAAPSE
ncbi:DUF5677 domain-containing protein [Brevundimonas sp. DC300-4]|uniref:DUF5677 domain-containing protein n=1 Tax=Brevundimonas sp. DC300-4 TaxID=2804594 RepID=UPI003CF84042